MVICVLDGMVWVGLGRSSLVDYRTLHISGLTFYAVQIKTDIHVDCKLLNASICKLLLFFLYEGNSVVEVKKILHFGSLNNVMMSVFGRLYDFGKNGGEGLEEEKQEAVCSQRLFLFLTF
uniref:Uncharacterized protein n=1 Tax=Helianthus annuus TaxID=4232 RepID=A0A251U3I8_HELAN